MYLIPFLNVDISARVLLTTVQPNQKMILHSGNELKFKSYQRKIQLSKKVKYHREQNK